MICKEEIYKIGIINKPHGIHGEVLFTFTDDIFDRVDCDYLVCLMDGIYIPFFLEEYRFRTDTTALVKFEDVDSDQKARRFTNVEVWFPVKYAAESREEEYSWDYFCGFQAENMELGVIGTITEVDTATINTLFVVDREGEEILIPAQEDFIETIDHKGRKILLKLPEGLLQIDNIESVD
ncbi:MAG: ribosome maturation factor RimM [Bacteroides sp.]|nr:ribosome maturation factor RimM [Bacteroides sp.]